MPEAWKQWEGQIIEGRFPLQKYLGGSEHSAVFLTERSDQEPHRAAIKLILADPASSEIELSHWRTAAQLFHPHLLRIFQMGRCQLDDVSLLYLVMECADEDLSQILPQRALVVEETRDMLEPVLDALVCIHRQGFVHGRLKPSNIMAVGDKIKLSTDSLIRFTETAKLRKPTVYDSPEAGSGRLSPASDIWSLGITLVETLTQHSPAWERVGHEDPVLPKSLPAPFAGVIRNCVRRDPNLRCTIIDISARLYPAKSVAPVAAATPVAVAAAPAVASDRAPQSFSVSPRPAAKPQKRVSQSPPLLGFPLSRFLFPALTLGVLVGLAFTVSKVWNRGSHPRQASVSTAENTKPQAHAPAKSGKAKPSSAPTPSAKPAQQHLAQSAVKTTSDKEPIKEAAVSAPPVTSAAPVASASEPAVSPKTSAGAVIPGEILDQVLPDVPQAARDTIYGKVRVSVKISVDSSGNITSVDLESPGPSQYFADQALAAARRWEFAPAKVDGRNVSTEWIVRFEFSQLDTQVFPKQTAP
jgi:TonB family protein